MVARRVHGDGSGSVLVRRCQLLHLEDWRGQRVKGRFYEPQLQKVKGLPNRWRVAKKLKYKGRGPKTCW